MSGVEEARAPSASESLLTQWMAITDANIAGNVHGGTIMKLADEVGALAAVRHCGRRVVTVGMDRMQFRQPVYVGDIVTVRSSVNAAWRTSMEVGVRVEAEDLRSRRTVHASTAFFTYVALDDEGRPVAVRPLGPETAEEVRREREAQVRRELRLAEFERLRAEREASPS